MKWINWLVALFLMPKPSQVNEESWSTKEERVNHDLMRRADARWREYQRSESADTVLFYGPNAPHSK